MRRLLICLFVCALAAAGADLHVSAATVSGSDLDTVSGNDLTIMPDSAPEITPDSNAEIMPLANYDTYYGSISTTYLEYMRGYLPKLPSTAHYVGARVSQYDYIFAYGDDLVYNGSTFSGSVTVARWNTQDRGSFTFRTDNNFMLDPGAYLVYTDLSDTYPALASSGDFTLRQILILLTMLCIGLTVNSMYQVRKIRRIERKENA